MKMPEQPFYENSNKIPIKMRNAFQGEVIKNVFGIETPDDEIEKSHEIMEWISVDRQNNGKKMSDIIDNTENKLIQEILLMEDINESKERWKEIVPMVIYMLEHDITSEEQYYTDTHRKAA